jgi:hypothetical protein
LVVPAHSTANPHPSVARLLCMTLTRDVLKAKERLKGAYMPS